MRDSALLHALGRVEPEDRAVIERALDAAEDDSIAATRELAAVLREMVRVNAENGVIVRDSASVVSKHAESDAKDHGLMRLAIGESRFWERVSALVDRILTHPNVTAALGGALTVTLAALAVGIANFFGIELPTLGQK